MTARFVDHACVFADGSPASVLPNMPVHEVPLNFEIYAKETRKDARKAWEATKRWRVEENIYNLVQNPLPVFETIREANPIYAHGRDKDGNFVLYERYSECNLKKMFDGISDEDHFRLHLTSLEYAYVNFFLKENPEGKMEDFGFTIVLDLEGVDIGALLRSRYIQSREAYLDLIRAHYPKACRRMLILNCPRFWTGPVSIALGFLAKGLTTPIMIKKEQVHESLLEHIDIDQLPPYYGGSSPYEFGQHPYHLEIQGITMSYLYPERAIAEKQDDATADSTTVEETRAEEQQSVEIELSELEESKPRKTASLPRNPLLAAGVAFVRGLLSGLWTIIHQALKTVEKLQEVVEGFTAEETQPEADLVSLSPSEDSVSTCDDTASIGSSELSDNQTTPTKRRKGLLKVFNSNNKSSPSPRKRKFLKKLSKRFTRKKSPAAATC